MMLRRISFLSLVIIISLESFSQVNSIKQQEGLYDSLVLLAKPTFRNGSFEQFKWDSSIQIIDPALEKAWLVPAVSNSSSGQKILLLQGTGNRVSRLETIETFFADSNKRKIPSKVVQTNLLLGKTKEITITNTVQDYKVLQAKDTLIGYSNTLPYLNVYRIDTSKAFRPAKYAQYLHLDLLNDWSKKSNSRLTVSNPYIPVKADRASKKYLLTSADCDTCKSFIDLNEYSDYYVRIEDAPNLFWTPEYFVGKETGFAWRWWETFSPEERAEIKKARKENSLAEDALSKPCNGTNDMVAGFPEKHNLEVFLIMMDFLDANPDGRRDYLISGTNRANLVNLKNKEMYVIKPIDEVSEKNEIDKAEKEISKLTRNASKVCGGKWQKGTSFESIVLPHPRDKKAKLVARLWKPGVIVYEKIYADIPFKTTTRQQ